MPLWFTAARWIGAGLAVATGLYGAYVGVTWYRYGHTASPNPDELDPLLDRFMPAYDVAERHHIRVAAPAPATLAAARELHLRGSGVVRTIIKARELILGATPDNRQRPRGLLAEMQSLGWGVLAEIPDREVVVGAVTRPWEANVTFRALPPDRFAAFDEPGYVKIAWTLRAEPVGETESVFRTETRVIATDPGARSTFRRYWSFLSPGIIVIRWALLGPLKREAERCARTTTSQSVRATPDERARALPGDERIGHAIDTLTHGVTIRRHPRDVWPWLAQMGAGSRGGWYSYDWLDNGRQPSATRLVPELQHPAVGAIFPALPGMTEGFTLLAIDHEKSLTLGWLTPNGALDVTWTFVLDEVASGVTRLLVRVRGGADYRFHGLPLPLTRLVVRIVHFVMQRKQLLGIKRRAESMTVGAVY